MAWSDVAQDVIDAGYSTFGVTADYAAGGVEPTTEVTVLVRQPDEQVALFGGSERLAQANLFEVRGSEVAAPAADDLLQVGGSWFKVRHARSEDHERLTFLLDCVPGSAPA